MRVLSANKNYEVIAVGAGAGMGALLGEEPFGNVQAIASPHGAAFLVVVDDH